MDLTAYDGNQWRIERLEKLLRIIGKITGLSRPQLDALIECLYDHKGELIVHWRHGECTERMQLAFKDAWGECGETNVHHSFEKGVF